LSLLVLPLSVPVLVFGAGAVEAAALDRSPDGPLMALAALLLAAMASAPFAAAAALRQAVE
ncbi:MAG: heme exporter protein CcmB, partial [Alphaproteobacteria bacterium]